MELYEKLRLPNPREIGFRYPHQVSGGQLQRAMTAMANGMPSRPDHLRTSPTTALDVTHADRGLVGYSRYRRPVQYRCNLHHP